MIGCGRDPGRKNISGNALASGEMACQRMGALLSPTARARPCGLHGRPTVGQKPV